MDQTKNQLSATDVLEMATNEIPKTADVIVCFSVGDRSRLIISNMSPVTMAWLIMLQQHYLMNIIGPLSECKSDQV